MLRAFILDVSVIGLLVWTAVYFMVVAASGGGRSDPFTMIALLAVVAGSLTLGFMGLWYLMYRRKMSLDVE